MGNELQKELEKMNNEIEKHEDYLKSEKTTYGLADLINGKIPSKQLPSEVNLTANTLDDMNALIASGTVNDGQLCYLKEDKKLYVLKDNAWSEVGGGGGDSIPVVEGTVAEPTQEDIDNGIVIKFTIPTAQEKNFILHSPMGYVYINKMGTSYLGIVGAEGGAVNIFYGDDKTISVSYTYTIEVVGASIGEKINRVPNITAIYSINDNNNGILNKINGNCISALCPLDISNNSFIYYYLDENSIFKSKTINIPTSIDFYIHNIVLKDTANTPTKKIYLTIQSTTNTPATTKELLQTLLGNTARYIRVSGYTPTNDISAINWTGTFDTSKYDVRGTETLLTDFTVIEDSVVTL